MLHDLIYWKHAALQPQAGLDAIGSTETPARPANYTTRDCCQCCDTEVLVQ